FHRPRNSMIHSWHRVLGLAGAFCALLVLPHCATHTQTGAGAGAAIGAAAGAIFGHQSGDRDKGALIGAAAGAAVGAAIGRRKDKQQAELARIAQTRQTDQGMIVTLAENKVYFETNSSKVGER